MGGSKGGQIHLAVAHTWKLIMVLMSRLLPSSVMAPTLMRRATSIESIARIQPPSL